MSQNPNNNPNYNPYTPNPSGPNYPPRQPTAYGGQQPPANPPSGSNPNTPNSGYGSGPYGNPYAPPPPGPGTGPNSYDPYAPTMMSQQPISGPTYPPYTPAPSAPEKRNSATTIQPAVSSLAAPITSSRPSLALITPALRSTLTTRTLRSRRRW